MRTEVPMPQMGESIAEGTVSKWLKKVGEPVDRDEPILEISTDKVDAEIPAPHAGVLSQILVAEGETVEVGTVIAYIESNGSATARGAAAEPALPQDLAPPVPAERGEPEDTAGARAARDTGGPDDGGAPEPERDGRTTAGARARRRSTPLVRRMAREHGIDLSALEGHGTGQGGRVTKDDLLRHLERTRDRAAAVTPAPVPSRELQVTREDPVELAPIPGSGLPEVWRAFYEQVEHPEFPVREGDRVEPMDKVRRLTAEHMVLAKRVASHVHSFIEIDFSRVDQLRREKRERWTEQGLRVSFTAFVAWAVSRALREFPVLNAVASGNNVIYRANVNLGIAVDLDPGLIVPVIRDADDLSLAGVAKRIVDLARRARDRRLEPHEIQGATFTITNPGVLGTLAGMPIIPKGTSGILGTGSIERRVVVVADPGTGADTVGIRKRAIFALGYDHRIVDGADAARFLAHLRERLEEFPGDA